METTEGGTRRHRRLWDAGRTETRTFTHTHTHTQTHQCTLLRHTGVVEVCGLGVGWAGERQRRLVFASNRKSVQTDFL